MHQTLHLRRVPGVLGAACRVSSIASLRTHSTCIPWQGYPKRIILASLPPAVPLLGRLKPPQLHHPTSLRRQLPGV
jgi:hypothetical protein